MILRLAASVLACLLLQDTEVDRLAQQLGHDESAKRQEAEQRLLEIGESARPALEKLAGSTDVEARTRARSILASLDRTAVRRKWLGPGWTVTLPEGDYLLGDLPALLKNQIPVPVQIPAGVADSRIRFGAKAMPAWEFLDRVGEAHGGLCVPLERPEGALALKEGKPGRAPTCYTGPFRISIDRITLEEREGWRGGRMVLAITWQPNVYPLNRDYLPGGFNFTIAEMIDESGAALKARVEPDPSRSGFTLDRSREGVWRSPVDIAFPPAGVRRLARVKGTVKMVFPSVIENVEFKKPCESATTPVKAGSFTITLASCKRTENGVIARIYIARAEAATQASRGRNGVELRSRFSRETMRLRGADGRSVPFDVRSSSHSSGSGEETAELQGFFAFQAEPEALSFPFVVDHFEHDVPFEFANVELP